MTMTATADQTAAVADAFIARLCFVCSDVLGARPDKTRIETTATWVWISGSPKFLAILLCGGCHGAWVNAANASTEHEQWPTATFKIT